MIKPGLFKNLKRAQTTARVKEFYDRYSSLYRNTTGEYIHGYNVSEEHIFLNHLQKLVVPESGKILDVGCGFAPVSIGLAKRNSKLCFGGITISTVLVQMAKEKILSEGLQDRVEIIAGDYHNLNNYYSENCFDAAILLETLGHSNDKVLVLKKILDVLKPGGKLYIRDLFRREYNTRREKSMTRKVIKKIDSVYTYHIGSLSEFIQQVLLIGYDLVVIQEPPYSCDFDTMVKFEKAAGFNTHEKVLEFPGVCWYEIVLRK